MADKKRTGPVKPDDEMKDEYNFAGPPGRGKFYNKNAVIMPLVHLEPEVLKTLQVWATAKGITLNQLVNDLLKIDIALIEVAT
jgi:hypothetical protein